MINISPSNIFLNMFLPAIFQQYCQAVLAVVSINGLKSSFSFTFKLRRERNIMSTPNLCSSGTWLSYLASRGVLNGRNLPEILYKKDKNKIAIYKQASQSLVIGNFFSFRMHVLSSFSKLSQTVFRYRTTSVIYGFLTILFS